MHTPYFCCCQLGGLFLSSHFHRPLSGQTPWNEVCSLTVLSTSVGSFTPDRSRIYHFLIIFKEPPFGLTTSLFGLFSVLLISDLFLFPCFYLLWAYHVPPFLAS